MFSSDWKNFQHKVLFKNSRSQLPRISHQRRYEDDLKDLLLIIWYGILSQCPFIIWSSVFLAFKMHPEVFQPVEDRPSSSQQWWGRISSTVSRSGFPGTRKTWTCWKESSRGPPRQTRAWSNSAVGRGWEGWDCSAWRTAGSGRLQQCVWTPRGRLQRRRSQAPFSGTQCQDKRQ